MIQRSSGTTPDAMTLMGRTTLGETSHSRWSLWTLMVGQVVGKTSSLATKPCTGTTMRTFLCPTTTTPVGEVAAKRRETSESLGARLYRLTHDERRMNATW